MIDTAGPSNTTADSVADLFITHIRLAMYLLLSTLSSVMQTESNHPPQPRVHWKSASAWKWRHQEKETNGVKRESLQKSDREYSALL